MQITKMKAVVLRLDPERVQQIDEIRTHLRLDRTWLRTAVDRNLKFDAEVTLPRVRTAFSQIDDNNEAHTRRTA